MIFGQEGFFHLALSEYPNQSHNLTHLNFCDVTLLYSIAAAIDQRDAYYQLLQKRNIKKKHNITK